MKKGYSDITIVLDRSGSMHNVVSDTIGGFNQFLSDQKEVDGEATITLAQFDDQYDIVYQGIDIQTVEDLNEGTFVPRGMTALRDAIGKTINGTGKRLSKMDEKDRPEKVIFVILTDGHENASQEYTSQKINEMIKHQSDNYQWEFVFLGANQDAISTADGFGISRGKAMTYASNSLGTASAYASVSDKMKMFRTGKEAGMSFDDDDRKKQEDAGA